MTLQLQSTIAKLLTKQETLSSKECEDQIQKITKRLEEIRSRNVDICDGVNGRGEILGKTRRRVSETGSPADLIKLDDEVRLLDAEDQSLCFQRESLRERQKAAVIEEAPALAKTGIGKLPAALKTAEAAKAAHDKATARLQDIQTEIASARKTAHIAGVDCPYVKLKMFERLAHCLDWYWFEDFIPRFKENGSHALHNRRLSLTDYVPEFTPILHDQTEAGKRRQASERRASEERKRRYLAKSSITELAGG